MLDKPVFYTFLWTHIFLAAWCVVTYAFLYLILTCQKRLQRKTYWLQCQLAICVILRSLCCLAERYMSERMQSLLWNDKIFETNRNETQAEFQRKHCGREYYLGYARLKGIFGHVSDFSVLGWNTFTLLTLYQFYYDLKNPLTLEKFSLRNALFTFLIWISAFCFCGVFVFVNVNQIPGYLIFLYMESGSIALLSALHILAMITLIALILRLQRNGFVIDLLPHDYKDGKVQHVLDRSWSRVRRRSFIMVYTCATLLIVANLLVDAGILRLVIAGPMVTLEDEFAYMRHGERSAWLIAASTWPVAWLWGDAGLRRKAMDAVKWIGKKLSAGDKVQEVGERDDGAVVYAISS